MISVRSVVEPYNRALGGAPTIFLNGSFVGLPLINQALFGGLEVDQHQGLVGFGLLQFG